MRPSNPLGHVAANCGHSTLDFMRAMNEGQHQVSASFNAVAFKVDGSALPKLSTSLEQWSNHFQSLKHLLTVTVGLHEFTRVPRWPATHFKVHTSYQFE